MKATLTRWQVDQNAGALYNRRRLRLELEVYDEQWSNDTLRAIEKAGEVEIHPGPCAMSDLVRGRIQDLEAGCAEWRQKAKDAERKLGTIRLTPQGALEAERDNYRRQAQAIALEVDKLKARIAELETGPRGEPTLGMAISSAAAGETAPIKTESAIVYFTVVRAVKAGDIVYLRDVKIPPEKDLERIWRLAKNLIQPKVVQILPETLQGGSVIAEIVSAVVEVMQTTNVGGVPIDVANMKIAKNPKPKSDVAARFAGLDLDEGDDGE